MERADRQLDGINKKIQRFLDGDPYGQVRKVDLERNEYIWHAQIKRRPRPSWALDIGELLHNLDASLDNLAWKVASVQGEPPQGTGFPVFTSKTKYRRTSATQSGVYMVRGMPCHAQAIIEDLQPHHARHPDREPLSLLRGLSNEDKHKTIHVVGSTLADRKYSTPVQRGVSMKAPTFILGPFEHDAVIARWPFPKRIGPDAEVQMTLRFAFDVAFAEGGAGQGRSVRHTLIAIRNAVWEAYRRLEPFARSLP